MTARNAPPTAPTCPHCDQPVTDNATLCHDGTEELVKNLRRLTSVVLRSDREPEKVTIQRRGPDGKTETVEVIAPGSYGRMPSTIGDTPSGEAWNLPRILDESAARLARRTTHARLKAMRTEMPIPIDLRAVDDAGRIRETIGRYATLLSGARVPIDAPWDVNTVASWLAGQAPAIRRHNWAPGMLTELGKIIDRAERHVDPPKGRHYLGICGRGATPPDTPEPNPGCPGQVFSVEDSPRGACNKCTALYDVQERRTARIEQLHGVRLTAAEIERVTTELGRRVARKTIDKWHERGRIARDEGKRYLVDDALRLAEASRRTIPT